MDGWRGKSPSTWFVLGRWRYSVFNGRGAAAVSGWGPRSPRLTVCDFIKCLNGSETDLNAPLRFNPISGFLEAKRGGICTYVHALSPSSSNS